MSSLKCIKCGKKVNEGEPYFTGYCAGCDSKRQKLPKRPKPLESSESVNSNWSSGEIKKFTKILRLILVILGVISIGGGLGVSFLAIERANSWLWFASWGFIMSGLYVLISDRIDRVNHEIEVEKIDADYKIEQMEHEIEMLKDDIRDIKNEINSV